MSIHGIFNVIYLLFFLEKNQVLNNSILSSNFFRFREEIGDKVGSKVSVLVFKEGEVINLIRVIENEDGSYSPYADKAISPPYRTAAEKEDNQVSFFKKITEDMEMASKMHSLKSKMQNLSVKRQLRNAKQQHNLHHHHHHHHHHHGSIPASSTSSKMKLGSSSSDVKKKLNFFDNPNANGISSSCNHKPSSSTSSTCLRSSRLAYRLLNDHMRTTQSPDYDQHLKKFESKITVQENFASNEEIGEIALKDKHRSKMKVGNIGKSLKKSTSSIDDKSDKFPHVDHFSSSSAETKSFSCRNLHVFEPERHHPARINEEETGVTNPILSPLYNRYSPETVLKNRRALHYDNKLNLDDLNNTKMSESIAILEESAENDDKDILSSIEVPCAETLSLSARNRVHLTQLVLQVS